MIDRAERGSVYLWRDRNRLAHNSVATENIYVKR